MRFDYTTVGHVTVDVMSDGSRRVGGGAFYSALQAARLGLRTQILTQGTASELEALLTPYQDELELQVLAEAPTTTLATSGSGARRAQRMLAWAGAIGEQIAIDTAILHLAPIARETPARWQGDASFVGLTVQGLVRAWDRPGAEVRNVALEQRMVPERCDAIVLSESERGSCSGLVDGSRRDALVAVTARARPTSLLLPTGEQIEVQVPPIKTVRDDLGAGDVFAAALFVALYEGRPPRQATALANAAAAVRIEGLGADAIGDRRAIELRRGAVA